MVRIGDELLLYIPPPVVPPETSVPVTPFPEKVQLVRVGEEPELNMPPPDGVVPPPRNPVPFVMVKPSNTAVEFTFRADTTGPSPIPALVLFFMTKNSAILEK